MFYSEQLMYARECKRMQSGLARTVPKLRETHIIRDSWTKLNVAPAKIMQVHYFRFQNLKLSKIV